MHISRAIATGAVALLLALLSAPAVSLAHERRTLASGAYDVVVGWDNEPAYVGEKNAASIRISKAGTNPAEPVSGVEKTLKVDLRQGAQTKSFPLRAVFGQPGYYVTDLIPTRDGDYVFIFNGSIGEDKINETFDSADGKFDAVQPATSLEFPLAAPDPVQISAALDTTRSTAQAAQTWAIAATAVALFALLGVGALWLTRPRPR